jgi:hypothetical protein
MQGFLKSTAFLRTGGLLTGVAAYCDKENKADKGYSQSVVQVPSQHAESMIPPHDHASCEGKSKPTSCVISLGGTKATFPSEPTRQPCDRDQRGQGCAAPRLDLDRGARRGRMMAGRRGEE